jgi:hypothetical protein
MWRAKDRRMSETASVSWPARRVRNPRRPLEQHYDLRRLRPDLGRHPALDHLSTRGVAFTPPAAPVRGGDYTIDLGWYHEPLATR